MKFLKLVLFLLPFANLAIADTSVDKEPNVYVEYRTKTYDLQFQYLEGITKHQAEIMRDMEYKLRQQRWQTNAIAIMVIFMVSMGLYLSFLQFKKDEKEGGKSSFSFKVGSGSFEINSTVIGLAILAMSFWFFQTYIDKVYSVEVFTVAPIDVTTFGVNR
jgi:hypothetical protein